MSGFKFSEYYYSKLWETGGRAPSLVAKEILENCPNEVITNHVKEGFFRYIFGGWEMVYNPTTTEVWHLMPIK